MTAARFSGRMALLGAALLIGAPLSVHPAEAARHRSTTATASSHARVIQAGMAHSYSRYAASRGLVARYGSFGGGLQCVPFARENTGIELAGNASVWWSAAEGVYQRGARPEVGSILSFRANGRMRSGHVAVVSNVVNGRTIEIDHANWSGPGAGRGRVTRDITVVDVSDSNDWTAVRVALGHTADFGSVYPTYGFIYDRPDKGTMVANSQTSPAPVLNAPPRDLRPASERYGATQEIEEVAEAADDTPLRSRRGTSHTSTRYGTRTHLVSAHGRVTTAARTSGKPSVVHVRSHSTSSPATKPLRAHRL